MRICHFWMQSYKIIRHKPSACKEKVENIIGDFIGT